MNTTNPWAKAHDDAKTNSVAALASKIHNDRVRVFDEWKAAKDALAVAQEAERVARDAMMEAWSDRMKDPMAEGAESIDTGFGKLTITHKIDRKVTGSDDAVEKALDKIEKSMVGGNVIADRLVSFKPELSVREYKLLSDANRAVIDEVITTKPASKQVKFEPKPGA